ncbi:hypothetical protein VI26_14215 [Chromobacterium sp. LK1]|uniref:hypothetical protein n=1 Tax=Chromobacterium sp. LK1 TaxID=1628193 RepID=UPI00065439EB|nr:hypothetical protein [Chromobacterium sp. LK1]KMN34149.1 hypothetical protein VI26_14215 [Chromobacterium sp. LK1]
MDDLSSYLAVLADSDLFGTLALICLSVFLCGLSRRVRESKQYVWLAMGCLLFMPMLHFVGTYFINAVRY